MKEKTIDFLDSVAGIIEFLYFIILVLTKALLILLTIPLKRIYEKNLTKLSNYPGGSNQA